MVFWSDCLFSESAAKIRFPEKVIHSFCRIFKYPYLPEILKIITMTTIKEHWENGSVEKAGGKKETAH